IPEDLVEVAARRAVAVGAAVTHDRVDPAFAETGLLDVLGRGVELLLARRAPAHVRDARRVSLGDDEAVVEGVTPRTEVDRLWVATGLYEAEHVLKEVDRLGRPGALQLDVRELGDQTEHCR